MTERARYDLTIYKGSTYRKTAWFKRNKAAIDLTGYTAKAQIRPSVNSKTLISEFSVEIVPAQGALTLCLQADETEILNPGTYEWDLQLIDPYGNVYYYLYGKTNVIGRVTE